MTTSFHDTADPSASRTFSYGCNLTSDWATAGITKVWGTFALQSGSEPTLSATIPEYRPLAWTPGCCYPTSGVLALSQGSASSDASFSLPCGRYSLSGINTLLPFTLPDCPG